MWLLHTRSSLEEKLEEKARKLLPTYKVLYSCIVLQQTVLINVQKNMPLEHRQINTAQPAAAEPDEYESTIYSKYTITHSIYGHHDNLNLL